MPESLRAVSIDGVEVMIPSKVVAHSSYLKTRSSADPIRVQCSGEELSKVIGSVMMFLTSEKRPVLGQSEQKTLKTLGLDNVFQTEVSISPGSFSMNAPADDFDRLINQRIGQCPFHQGQAMSSRQRGAGSPKDIAHLPLITLEEFMARDGTRGRELWILIESVVFNVTDYLTKHPGGKTPLMQGAGRDSTALFYKHHGRKGNVRPLFNRLGSLAIGRLSKYDLQRVPGYKEITAETCANASLRKQFLQFFSISEEAQGDRAS